MKPELFPTEQYAVPLAQVENAVLCDLQCCVNNDQGDFTGMVDQIQLGDDWVKLSGESLRIGRAAGSIPAIALATEDLRASVSLPFVAHQTWVGNIYWDNWRVSLKDVPALLNFLRERGWQPEDGLSDIWDIWCSGQQFTVENLERAIA